MNVFKRLETLEEQGFIAKRYFDNYRLLHKPVVYYLLPAGARKLSEHRDKDDTGTVNIKGIYKDAAVSEQFAMHCVAILDLYNFLTAQYDDELEFLTKSDQIDIDSLPKQKPDVYAMLETNDGTKHFFLDVLDNDTHLLIDASKKMKRYIEYKRSGDWVLVDKALFPKIIFVCNSEEAAKRVQKRCNFLINKSWLLEIECETVTKDMVSLD